MSTELVTTGGIDFTPIVKMVTDAVDSEHTRRAYRRALADFLTWYTAIPPFDRDGNPKTLNKATVQSYAAGLRDGTANRDRDGNPVPMGASSINQRLSAIRKLAHEAAENEVMSQQLANGIKAIKGIRQGGERSGNWLTKEQAQKLINSPNVETLKGLRDRAILSILVGCGLRRAECASLTVDHVQERDGRWVIVDLVGKRNKTRSVPMPSWARAAINAWEAAAGITEGRLFRAIHKGGYVNGETMTDQAIADVVTQYTAACGFPVAAHDLRRTYAKLAHKGGAGLDQIQLSLGHASIQTTERYLGVEQDLTDAPCDHLGIKLE
jgi:site-specific recombinase XerD